jgi:hypothetical protein
MTNFLKQKSWTILLVISFVLLFALRIIDLGYSDYNTDEATVLGHLKREGTVYSADYLLSQRKGPLQWLVASLPYLLFGDIGHEFWYRLPFALFNFAALYFLYHFLLSETKNKYLSLGATFLVGVNGLLVAFSRFVQYQSLNLFFSFVSLYFYSRFLHEDNKKMSYFGAVAFSVSLLAHWDALFILPYISYVLLKKFSLKTVLINFSLILIFCGPFLIPLLAHLKGNNADLNYFFERLGWKDEYSLNEVRFRTLVYNPFLFSSFVTAFLALSLFFIKKYLTLWIWFLGSLVAFIFFIKVPGTHVYNLLVPAMILAAVGYYEISKYLANEYKIVPIGLFIAVLCFLYYQTYLLLVNHQKEYPWEQIKIFRYETSEYDHGDLTNHLIGFSHGRNWVEVNRYINKYLKEQPDAAKYTYITNENKTISDLYMDIPYGVSNKYLAIGVKNPYNFATDYQFSQVNGKRPLKEIKNSNGETVVKIYEVISENKNNENDK